MARVLVVDDDPAVLAVLTMHVESLGHCVEQACTGQEAVTRFRNDPPDVMLLDLRMPEMDGLAVLRQVTPPDGDTPIIMVSGEGQIPDAVEALKVGAWDYLVKPIESGEILRHAIDRALERRLLLRQIRQYQYRLEERAAQLQRLASQLTQAEQRERRRIAQVLHEHFQQALAGAKLNLGALRRWLPEAGPRKILQQAEESIDESIRISRSLTVDLCPPVLHDYGLAAGLGWLGRDMYTRYNLHVDVQADSDADPPTGDVGTLLFHCVRELLFNVVKHARVGRAAVTMRRTADRWTEIVVADEGVGFVFRPGVEVAESYGGFGLFSIRERLEVMGGTCRVETAPRQGTRVTIRVPIHPDGTPPVSADASAGASLAAAPTTGKIHVVVVDDHAIVRDGLVRLLDEAADIEVVGQAEDGQAAVDLARQVSPDVVLMDVTMPRMNGVDATVRIRQEVPRTRVIGLSMHMEEDMAAKMAEAGAAGYLVKTAAPESLVKMIRACVSSGGSEP